MRFKNLLVPLSSAVISVGGLAMLSGCSDEPLQGPLKTCIIQVDFPAGNCSLCGVAILDGEIVNTENFTVLESETRDGYYTDYDDWAAEACTTYWPPDDVVYGSLQATGSCEELGYAERDLFTFENGETETYNHDGSCTTTTDPLSEAR